MGRTPGLVAGAGWHQAEIRRSVEDDEVSRRAIHGTTRYPERRIASGLTDEIHAPSGLSFRVVHHQASTLVGELNRAVCPLNLGNVSTDRHRRLDGPRLFGVRRWARRVPRRSRCTRRGSGRRRRLGCDRAGRPGADQGLPDTPVGEVGPQRVAGTGVTGDESRMRRRSFVGQMIRPSQQHFSLVLVPFGVECSLRINVR